MAYLNDKTRQQLETIIRNNRKLINATGCSKNLKAQLNAEIQDAQNILAQRKEAREE